MSLWADAIDRARRIPCSACRTAAVDRYRTSVYDLGAENVSSVSPSRACVTALFGPGLTLRPPLTAFRSLESERPRDVLCLGALSWFFSRFACGVLILSDPAFSQSLVQFSLKYKYSHHHSLA